MAQFGQLLFNLLITPPGNFIYHLVLIFSVTASIQALLANNQNNVTPQSQKMLIALWILLAGQIILFLSSGLAWQNLLDLRALLPPLDRVIILLSMLWISWLWCFPDPSRLANIITVVLSLFASICFMITVIFWINVYQTSIFNASWFDFGWTILALLTLVSGITILLVQKPQGIGVGLTILGINLVGYIIHIIWATAVGDFVPSVRYTNIISFPLLPLLSQHIQKTTKIKNVEPEFRFTTEKNLASFMTLLNLATEHDPSEIRAKLSKAIVETTGADVCILVCLCKAEKRLLVESGYDSVSNKFIKTVELNMQHLPGLTQYIQRGELRTFFTQQKVVPDLNILSRSLKIKPILSLILIPMMLEDNVAKALLIGMRKQVLAPSIEEKTYLLNLVKAIAPLLEESNKELSKPSAEEVSGGNVKMSHAHTPKERSEGKKYGIEDYNLSTPNLHSSYIQQLQPTGISQSNQELGTSRVKDTGSNESDGEIGEISQVTHLPIYGRFEQIWNETVELVDSIQKVQWENRELSSRFDRLYSGDKNEGLNEYRDIQNADTSLKQIVQNTNESIKTTDDMVETLLYKNKSLEISSNVLSTDNANLIDLLSSLNKQNQALSRMAQEIYSLYEVIDTPKISEDTFNKVMSDLEAHENRIIEDVVEDTNRIMVKSRFQDEKDGETTQPVNVSSTNLVQDQGTVITSPSEVLEQIAKEAQDYEHFLELKKEITSVQQDVREISNKIQARQKELNNMMRNEISFIHPTSIETIADENENIKGIETEAEATSITEKPWRENEQLRITLQEVIDVNLKAQNDLNHKIEEMEEQIKDLKDENDKLKLELSIAHDTLNNTLLHQQKIDSELRMTLEELAHLENLVDKKGQNQAIHKE